MVENTETPLSVYLLLLLIHQLLIDHLVLLLHVHTVELMLKLLRIHKNSVIKSITRGMEVEAREASKT